MVYLLTFTPFYYTPNVGTVSVWVFPYPMENPQKTRQKQQCCSGRLLGLDRAFLLDQNPKNSPAVAWRYSCQETMGILSKLLLMVQKSQTTTWDV